MFKKHLLALFVTLSVLPSTIKASDEQKITVLFETIKPYIVSIEADVSANIADKPARDSFKKTGLIINSGGYVLTSYLSSEITTNIRVYVGLEEYPAKLVGSDKVARITLLKIDSKLVPPKVTTDIRFAKVPLKTGQSIITIGSLGKDYQFEKAINTGMVAAILPFGLSNQIMSVPNINIDGAVLLNMSGEIAGIVAPAYWFNLSLTDIKKDKLRDELDMMRAEKQCLEIESLTEIIGRIIKKQGDSEISWAGIEFDNLSKTQSEGLGIPFKGILITKTYKDSPALKGGLLPKDVIIEINGRTIPAEAKGARLFSDLIRSNMPGGKMNFRVIRNKEEKTFQVEPVKYPELKQPRSSWLGITVEEVNDALYNSLNLFTDKGLLIVDVEQGTPASYAKLERSDVITHIQLAEVSAVSSWQNILGKLKDKNTKYIIVQVYRGNKTMTRIIKPELGAKRQDDSK
ncbi:MAG: PDZ domain-containing protein [Elusimicrobia bacterium]|nr:PDZ domain-containing protein [Elusimicrobiota bacterium]